MAGDQRGYAWAVAAGLNAALAAISAKFFSSPQVTNYQLITMPNLFLSLDP